MTIIISLSPILVAKDTMTACMLTQLVPSKRGSRSNAKYLVDFILNIGCGQCAIRSDQESSLMALRDEAIKICEEQFGSAIRIMTEESPIGSSASNGRAEAAVRSMSGIVRSLLSILESRFGAKCSLSHPIHVWIVFFVVALVRRYRFGCYRAQL